MIKKLLWVCLCVYILPLLTAEGNNLKSGNITVTNSLQETRDHEINRHLRGIGSVSSSSSSSSSDEPGRTKSSSGLKKQRVAIATFLTKAETKSQDQYTYACAFLISTLRSVGYKGPVVVLATDDVKKSNLDYIRGTGAKVQMVAKLATKNGTANKSYKAMLTKLHLWSLPYERVIYYDSDHVFLRNPVPGLLQVCQQELCATSDTGVPFVSRKGNYFNAGFMMIKPQEEMYQHLLSKAYLAEGKTFAEQVHKNPIPLISLRV